LKFFPNGRQDYESYIQHVALVAASKHVSFWHPDEQLVLPPESWWDYFHLNLQGVHTLSQWLGNKLAEADRQGELAPLRSTGP
jgi:hypothetical protein